MDIGEIFEEYGGRIFLILSVISVFVALLTMSATGTWLSAVMFLLSVAFFLAGFAFQFEWIYGDIKSKETISTVLICASIMILATAGVLLLFREPVNFRLIGDAHTQNRFGFIGPNPAAENSFPFITFPILSPSNRPDFAVMFDLASPYAGVSGILGLIGIALFIMGFVLKLRSG